MVAMGWRDKNHFSSKNKSGYAAFMELMRLNFFNYTNLQTLELKSRQTLIITQNHNQKRTEKWGTLGDG